MDLQKLEWAATPKACSNGPSYGSSTGHSYSLWETGNGLHLHSAFQGTLQWPFILTHSHTNGRLLVIAGAI